MTTFSFGVLCGALGMGGAWLAAEAYRALAAAMDRDDDKDGGKYS